jgi:hypothetical protein
VRDVLHGEAEPAVTLPHSLNVMRALELSRESNARHCTMPWAEIDGRTFEAASFQVRV